MRTSVVDVSHDERKELTVVDGATFLEQVAAWLRSPEAVRKAEAFVTRTKVPMTAEELCTNALTKVWEQMQKNPNMEVASVRAYCITTMWHEAINCLRSQKRIAGIFPDLVIDAGAEDDTSAGGNSSLQGRLRACVESLGFAPAPTSATLTFISLQAHGDGIDVSDLPRPERGANEDHALWWPSLHLAYQNKSLFPKRWADEGKARPNAAQRQRLRRVRIVAEQLLSKATLALAGGTPS